MPRGVLFRIRSVVYQSLPNTSNKQLVVGCFGFNSPFETVFQSISGHLPERGRKKREVIDERKNVQTTPPAPPARAVGPCPTILINSIKVNGCAYRGSNSTFLTPFSMGVYSLRKEFAPSGANSFLKE